MADYSRYEMETSILYNQEEKTASVYTCNPTLIRRLDKFCEQFPDQFKLETKDEHSKTYIIPKKYISIRGPKVITEEQKEKASERGRRALAFLRQKDA